MIRKQANIGHISEGAQYHFRVRMNLSTSVSHVRHRENAITYESPVAMWLNVFRVLSIFENVSIAPGTACTSGSLAAERIVSAPAETRLATGVALALSIIFFVDCHWLAGGST
jgi:hypothetical protein